MRGGQNRLLTPEQHEYFVRKNKGRSQADMVRLMKKRFGLELTEKQINTYRKNHHLHSGRTGQFEKGHVSWNKGKHFDVGGRSVETRFKKGQRPHNYMPVGSERINTEGYVDIKIADPNKWKAKHVLLWEALHGPRPKGYKIIFADGNKLNVTAENLLLVSSSELCRMNQNDWIKPEAELTKLGATVAKLICKTNARKEKPQRTPKPKPRIIYYDPKTMKIL